MDNEIEARREAVRTCGEMMRDAPEGFLGHSTVVITVTNAAGLVLWEIYINVTASAAAPV